MNEPPLPHLTGEKTYAGPKTDGTRPNLVYPVIALGMSVLLLGGVFGFPRKTDPFHIVLDCVNAGCGLSFLVGSIKGFAEWLKERNNTPDE